MRVLVTGGLGFLGNAVTHRLVAEHLQPFVLTSRPGRISRIVGVETVESDIRDRESLTRIVQRIQPDAVCHLAAVTRVRDSFIEPLRYFDINVGGTVVLLQAISSFALPVVFVSTGAVYGPCEGRISEEHPTLPTNPYGASKLAAEHLLTYHARAGRIGTTILRCFNISGAVNHVGDSDSTRIIPKALAVAAGREDYLSINGDGSAVREFSHVADVAAAVTAALKQTQIGESSVYNVGSGIECSMATIVKTVEAVTGRQIRTRNLPPKNEPAVLVSDSTRLRGALNWIPDHISIDSLIRDASKAQKADIGSVERSTE